MKKLILAVLMFAPSVSRADAYFRTIFSDPTHPKMSASALYTSDFSFDGAVTDVAVAYHKADPEDSLWPKKLLDLGFPPLSWTLLELGGGGNTQSAFAHFGASLNVAPTVLGPLVSALRGVGGKAATLGNLLISPDGSGLKMSLGWKSNVIQDKDFVRFNRMRFPPRYGVGFTYQF